MARINDLTWVSPLRRKDELAFPIGLDVKVDIFEERTFGWQIAIADQCYRGLMDSHGTRISPGVPHSGFGALYIILSYFEMISKYHEGDLSEVSGKWFINGVKLVYPELSTKADQILQKLWEGARCGLYHA